MTSPFLNVVPNCSRKANSFIRSRPLDGLATAIADSPPNRPNYRRQVALMYRPTAIIGTVGYWSIVPDDGRPRLGLPQELRAQGSAVRGHQQAPAAAGPAAGRVHHPRVHPHVVRRPVANAGGERPGGDYGPYQRADERGPVAPLPAVGDSAPAPALAEEG